MHIIQVQPEYGTLLDAVVALQAAVDAVDCPWHNGLTARALQDQAHPRLGRRAHAVVCRVA